LKNIHYISTVRLRDMKNLLYILAALAFMGIGVLTIMGEVQKVIPFADPLNEIGFAFITILMGILTLLNIELKTK